MTEPTDDLPAIAWEDRDYGFLGNVGTGGFSYQIVTSPDGQVSWNGPFGDGRWLHVDSIEKAKAASLQDLHDHRSELATVRRVT